MEEKSKCDRVTAEFIALLALVKLNTPTLAGDLLYEIRYYHYASCYIRRPTMRAALENLVESGLATKYKWRFQITTRSKTALRELIDTMPEGILELAGTQIMRRFADEYDSRLEASMSASLTDDQTLSALVKVLWRIKRQSEVNRLEAEGNTWPYDVLREARNGIKEGCYHVYVVKLDPQIRELKQATNDGMPCVYIGETGLSPEERFERHKNNIWAGRIILSDHRSRYV